MTHGNELGNERRDAFMFLGFVVLCITVVLTVLIVNGDWPTDRWVAIGAVAAVVQAVGVTLALIFGGRQLRLMNAQRRDPIVDRIEEAIYTRLNPAVDREIRSWIACHALIRNSRELLADEAADVYQHMVDTVIWPRYEESHTAMNEAYGEIRASTKTVERLLKSLGVSADMSVHMVHVYAMRFTFKMPYSSETLDQTIRSDSEIEQPFLPSIEAFRKSLQELEAFVEPLFERRDS